MAVKEFASPLRYPSTSLEGLVASLEKNRRELELFLNTQVIRLGQPISTLSDVSDTAPSTGQAMVWNGTEWVPTSLNDQHTHDGRYYTESETNTLLAAKSDDGHTHDTRYYTESEADARFLGISANAVSASKWATARTITLSGDVSATSPAWDGSGNLSFANTTVANDSHTHNNSYYTETESDARYARFDEVGMGHTVFSTYNPGSSGSYLSVGTLTIGFVSAPASAKLLVVGSGYVNNATDANTSAYLRVGVSFNNGSTYSYGQGLRAQVGTSWTTNAPITAQYAASGSITTAIKVQLSYLPNSTNCVLLVPSISVLAIPTG